MHENKTTEPYVARENKVKDYIVGLENIPVLLYLVRGGYVYNISDYIAVIDKEKVKTDLKKNQLKFKVHKLPMFNLNMAFDIGTVATGGDILNIGLEVIKSMRNGKNTIEFDYCIIRLNGMDVQYSNPKLVITDNDNETYLCTLELGVKEEELKNEEDRLKLDYSDVF